MPGKSKRPVKKKAAKKSAPKSMSNPARMVFDEGRRLGLSVISSIRQGVIVFDKHLRYKLWNPFMEELTGIRAVEIIGKPDSETGIFPFLEKEGITGLIENALRGDSVQTPDLAFTVEKTGKKGWVSAKLVPHKDEQGRIIGVVGTVMDITARKEAELHLQKAEERYRQLFEAIPSAVAVYEAVDDGKDFVFRDFNLAGEKIECLSREGLLGRRLTEAFPGVEIFGLLDVLREVWKTGTPMHHPVTEYKDERIAGYRENFVYKLPSGEIVAVYSDVTEQKKAQEALAASEERFRSIFEGVGDAIVVHDAETLKILEFNSRACESLGYSREEFRELSPKDLEGGLSPERVEETRREVLETGRALFDTKLKTRSGHLRDVRVSLRRCRMGGRPCVISVWGDKTLFKEAADVIDKQQREWRSLMMNLPNGFAVHQMIYKDGKPFDYRFLDVNDVFEKLVGLSRREVIGKTVKEVLPGIEEFWVERYGRVAQTGEPAHFTNYSGKLGKWYQVWAYQPWPDHFAVIFTDVSDIEKTKLKS